MNSGNSVGLNAPATATRRRCPDGVFSSWRNRTGPVAIAKPGPALPKRVQQSGKYPVATGFRGGPQPAGTNW